MTARKQNNKNPKVKQFLFFLGIAVIFWLLTNFSKDRVTIISANLEYTQIPNSAILSEKNSHELSFEVNSSGFALLFHSLKKPVIEVPVSDYYQEGDSLVEISAANVSRMIEKQLDLKDVINISKSKLDIYLDKTIAKKIPVELLSQISFKNGFRSSNGLLITPDSVTVTGPSEIVNSLTSISTQSFARKDISESIEQLLPLDKKEFPSIQLSPSEVTLTIEVHEYTQKEVVVPVTLKNAPEDHPLKLIPTEVTLSFEVSIEEFSEISAGDFTVECDYENRVTDGNFMIPKIVKQPKNLFQMEVVPRKIEYLIFK